jgi:hypothetical protein
MNLSRFSDNEYSNRVLGSLTEAERGYFIACTDIFHDKQYNVIGRPSVSSQLQNTIVLNLTRTISSADFGISPTANWDVNIVSLPFITSQQLVQATDTGINVQIGAGAPVVSTGGVTMFGATTGNDMFFPMVPAAVQTLNADYAIYPGYTFGSPVARHYYQILSAGIEIVNATPELYRSGNVIRYRVPTQGRDVPISIYSTDPASAYDEWPRQARESFRAYPLPPSSAALASQYPDSIIDEAVNGSYQMHTLQDIVSDFYCAGNERVMFTSPSTSSSTANPNALVAASLFNNAYNYDPPLVRGDFDMVGSYFVGLTPQALLTIRYRVILSQVPASSDTYLVSLAKTSPPANFELDTLISLVQNEFLPGIPAGMNPNGEWWKVVLKGIAKVGKKVGKSALQSALNQGAQGLITVADTALPGSGEILRTTAKTIDTVRKQNNRKKKKKKNGKSQANLGGRAAPGAP